MHSIHNLKAAEKAVELRAHGAGPHPALAADLCPKAGGAAECCPAKCTAHRPCSRRESMEPIHRPKAAPTQVESRACGAIVYLALALELWA